ncbi:MAG: tetratricopeptide repeat protein [Acidobacteriia bacterium]|nr:tetratricopeptide repeat protein [Terriglobia bacterium]
MLRLLALTTCILAAAVAFAQGPTPLTGPATQESTALAPSQFHHAEPPDPNMTASQLEGQADTLRAQKYYADAIDYYRAALAKSPKAASLWNKLGIAELQLMRYVDAGKDFDRAVKLEPGLSDAVNNRGVVFYIQQDYKKAIKLYRKAIGLRPGSASFHSNLATALFSRQEFDKASAEYLRALELDPDILERQSSGGIQAHIASPQDRARYSYVVAKLYARNGNFERSLHYLRKAIEEGYPHIESVYKDEEFAALRKDPRFEELMNSRPQAIPQ